MSLDPKSDKIGKTFKAEKKSSAAIPMFSGDLSFMGCPRIDLKQGMPSKSLVVLGIPFDASTSNRPGTRFGPRSIRAASKMISWQKLYPWKDDLYDAENAEGVRKKVFDGGDVEFDFGQMGSIITAIENAVSLIRDSQSLPLILGGDHFVSYPALRAIHRKCKQPLALVHFDAHYDMWDDEAVGSVTRIDHGTGFYHAVQEGLISRSHSLQIGLRTHKENSKDFTKTGEIESLDAFVADKLSAEEIAFKIREKVGTQPAYLTFDIDFLDPAYAPGTGTPVCGGFTTLKALDILRRLGGLDWLGADIVEVSPPYDHGEITSLAGATIAAYLGHLLMKAK